MSDHLFDFLRVLFAGLEGEITFDANGAFLNSRDPDAIEAFLADKSGAVWVSLGVGEVANFKAYHLCGDEEMDLALETLGSPDLALFNAERNEAVMLFSGDKAENGWSVLDCPLPGHGNWSLTDTTVAKITEQPVEQESSPEASPEPQQPSSAPFKINDAEFVGGDLPKAVLDLPLKIGFGRSRDDKRWPGKPLPFSALLGLMSKHEAGDKDGKAFIQGTAIGNERKAKAMEQMCIVGLDLDSGIFPDKIAAVIQDKLKLASIIYTTHSHDSTETHVVQNSFAQWARKHHQDEQPSTTSMRRYMREAKKWEDWIVNTIELQEEPVHTKDGISYVLTHDAMPKFRIIFPLAFPYVIAKQKLSQADAINLWKGRLLGLAKILEVPIDESCLDPSRLFYLPRHKEGRAFKVIVTSGAALDFDAVPDLQPRAKDRPDDDVFVRAAKELGAVHGDSLMVGDFSLKRWASQIAGEFDIVELFRQQAPNKIRTDYNTSKIEIECPFDYEHGNAGDTEDRGAWVQSAHADDTDAPFQWGCRHNCCSRRDRLTFMAEAIRSGWFTTDDIASDRYRIFTVEEQKPHIDPKIVTQNALDTVKEMAKGMTSAVEIENMLEDLLKQGLPKHHVGIVSDAIRDRNIMPAKRLQEITNDVIRRHALAESEEDRDARLRASIAGSIKATHETALHYFLTPDRGYSEQRKTIIDCLNRKNSGNLTGKDDYRQFFAFGGVTYHVTKITDAEGPNVRSVQAEWANFANYLAGPYGCYFYRLKEDNLASVELPQRILSELIVSTEIKCPNLKGFSDLPYFSHGYKLVTKHGYDESTGIYLKPILDPDKLNAPLSPSKDEMRAARDRLLEHVFADFPFDDGLEEDASDEEIATNGQASRAHFMALLLQPFVRDLIDGPTPIYLVSKPSPNTGASLLVGSALTINTGKKPATATETALEEEQRKNITTAFRMGKTYYWLDNVNLELRSSAYCNLATARVWEDRILGKSESANYPNRMQFIIGGNNPRGTYEVMRRCVPIRLDCKGDPNSRDKSKFKVPDLETYVADNQLQLLRDVLTLIGYWVEKGHKPFRDRELSSFEAWSRVMGGILEACEIPGFLTNMHLTKATDEETNGLKMLYSIWMQRAEFKAISVKEVAEWFLDDFASHEHPAEEFPNFGAVFSNDIARLQNSLKREFMKKRGHAVDIKDKEGRTVTVALKRQREERHERWSLEVISK